MHRFYIAPEFFDPQSLRLVGNEAHHARNVLRLERGNRVAVFDGRGREVTAEVVEASAAGVELRRLHEAQTPPLRCRITLAQAIPKAKNMDWIVQKAVEIGAAEIVPLLSERTVIRLGESEIAQKQQKWQAVAIEAAKQCGQNWLPEIATPQTIPQFFGGRPRSGIQLVASLQPDAKHLKKVLGEYREETGGRPTDVLILVGPEGDFTPAELSLARSHGCQPITLGPIILRVETAALYCLSVLSYELLNADPFAQG